MVIFSFWLAVMVLCLIALALLLPPLLRRRAGNERRRIERELAALKQRLDNGEIDPSTHAAERQRLSDALVAELERDAPAPARNLALVLAVLVPTMALGLYFAIGAPQALDPQSLRAPAAANVDAPQQMDQAIASLEQRLRAQPDNVDGWLLLARSYRATERFADMQRATSSAMALAPTMPDVQVEHAEALALNSASRRFDGQSRSLLEQALATDDRHQKALWLLGISELQDGRNDEGLAYWQRLRDLLQPDDPIALRIDEQIAAARARGGPGALATAAQTPATPEASDDPVDGPHVRITVELDPSLSERLHPGDTLFVFARSPAGGPPLAIRRIGSPQFPVTVTLSQNERMIEGLQLQAGAEVALGARISRAGNAQAQSGDLQAPLQTHAVSQDGSSAQLRITEIVP